MKISVETPLYGTKEKGIFGGAIVTFVTPSVARLVFLGRRKFVNQNIRAHRELMLMCHSVLK